MRITSIYLFKIIIKIITQTMLWVILIVALADWSNQTAKISATYSWKDALHYVILMIPTRIQLTLPLIFLISGMILIIQLKKTQELTAIQILGGSIYNISKTLLFSAIIITLLCLTITEVLAPSCLLKAKQLRSNVTKKVLLTTNGLWWWETSNNNASFNHIKSINQDGSLNNILIIQPEIENYKVQNIILAKTAIFQNNEWILKNVQDINTNNGKKHYIKSLNIAWHITPLIIKALSQQDRMLNLYSLYERWQFSKYSMSENTIVHGYNFIHRILNPIYSVLCFLFLWSCSHKLLFSEKNKYTLIKFTGYGLLIYILDMLIKPLIMLFPNQLIILSLSPILLLLTIMVFNNLKINRISYD